MEAIASEVATLRRHFPASVTWGLSHRRWALVAPRRGNYCLNPKLHLLFRGATRLLEPIFHLNHIFGSLDDWFYLQGMRRRPTVLTMAVVSELTNPYLMERVDRFVVEFESAREQLLCEGISPNRIRIIFPPVNLAKFAPTNRPDGPFTVLFASSPELPSWLEARGAAPVARRRGAAARDAVPAALEALGHEQGDHRQLGAREGASQRRDHRRVGRGHAVRVPVGACRRSLLSPGCIAASRWPTL